MNLTSRLRVKPAPMAHSDAILPTALCREILTAPLHETLAVPRNLSLRAIHNLPELLDLSAEWNELLAEYPPATTFSTMEWLASWWQSYGQRSNLLVLALLDSESRLVGLAPLSICRERFGFTTLRVLRLMGDGSGDSDNLDMPVRPGYEREFATLLFEYLNEQRRGWDVCRLNTMPSNSPMVNLVAECCKSQRWLLFEYNRVCSFVPLPNSWEQYEEQLVSEDRKNLQRYARRLQKRHVTRIYRCTREDELDACLEALYRLHQLRWEKAGEPGSFSSPERRDFYGALSRRLLKCGQLEFWILELDGVIRAAQFAFRFRNRVFQLQEGYDPDYSSDRVGFILRGEALRQLLREGVTVYDFLGGTDAYKTRWGARVGSYIDLHFAPRLSQGGAVLWTLDSASRGKRWLRSRLPAGTWRLLHKLNAGARGLQHRVGQSASQDSNSNESKL